MSDFAFLDSVKLAARRLTRRAKGQLYFETYAPIFALSLLILTGFIIGSALGVWERVGDPFRAISLIAVLVLLGRAVLTARRVQRPDESRARRRVEVDSGVSHRPLDTLYDDPALPSDVWSVHYQRAVQAVHRLAPSKLRPTLAPIDPYHLRFIAPTVLGFALVIGFGENYERLRRAFTPTWQAGVNPSDVSFEAWIDPPDYTGRPPIYFKGKEAVEIPAGSEFVARLSGAKSAPRLKITSGYKTRYISLKRLDGQTLEARTVLSEKAKARWRVGHKVQNWDLNVIADTPPDVKFEETPSADKRDRLVLNYSFSDDYGVEALSLEMRRLVDDGEDGPVKTVDIPLQSRSVKRVERRETELDLTKNLWAGEKVEGFLVARDGLGQATRSERVFFTVPDKIFIEPMAKAIVEHRGLVLAGDGDYAPLPAQNRPVDPENWASGFDTFEPELRLERAPQEVQRAADLIEALTDIPEGIFEDPAIYMGLRNVLSRLRYADMQEDLDGIPEDLWSIAIRAEFGLLGTALQEMQEAEENLRDGIARRAPQREVDTLFDRYNAAVDAYMEELVKNATVSEGSGEGGGGDPRDMAEIQELLKAIEEANRVGDTEGARKALAQLAEILEKMKIEMSTGSGEGGESPPGELTEEMIKSLEDMADLLGEQRELKDETEQAQNGEGAQGPQPPGASGDSATGPSPNPPQDGPSGPNTKSPPSSETLSAQQRALQEALDALSGVIDDSDLAGKSASGDTNAEDGPGGGGDSSEDETADGANAGKTVGELLKDAEQAMADSAQALNDKNLQGSAEAQARAISALRGAGRALAQSAKGEGNADSDETNPLGQENGSENDDGFEAEIDERDNATRSRELLEELRRRAAEQEREQIEREYLERLLKRF